MDNNVASSTKTDTFRFRINPDVRKQVEEIYSRTGLSLTQAINIFIRQSINAGGLPFQATEDNAELLRVKSMVRLMKELDAGKRSGEPMTEEEVYNKLGIEMI